MRFNPTPLIVGLAVVLGPGAAAPDAPQLGPAWWADMRRTNPAGSVTADGPRRVASLEAQVTMGPDGAPVAVTICCETGPLAERAAALVRGWRYNSRSAESFRAAVAVAALPGVPDAPFPASAETLRITLHNDAYGILMMGGGIPGAGGSVEIDQDGALIYLQGFVPSPPGTPPDLASLMFGAGKSDLEPRHGQISHAELDALIQQFRAANFYTLDGLYNRSVDHTPTVTLTLAMDGRTMTVADHGGAAPAAILDLQKSVLALARKATGLAP